MAKVRSVVSPGQDATKRRPTPAHIAARLDPAKFWTTRFKRYGIAPWIDPDRLVEYCRLMRCGAHVSDVNGYAKFKEAMVKAGILAEQSQFQVATALPDEINFEIAWPLSSYGDTKWGFDSLPREIEKLASRYRLLRLWMDPAKANLDSDAVGQGSCLSPAHHGAVSKVRLPAAVCRRGRG